MQIHINTPSYVHYIIFELTLQHEHSTTRILHKT